jgi:hypothetical protein
MRLVLTIAALAMLVSCASGPNIDMGPRPPEGPGPAGTDFGYWNRDSDGSVDQAFRAFIFRRYDVKDAAQAKADLTKDGFTCEDAKGIDGKPGALLTCIRIYYRDDFYHTWSVEFWPQDREPRVHYTRTATRNPLSDTQRNKKSQRQPGGA